MLGEGAMGVVYRGIDEQSSTPVAIKTLQPTAFHSPKAHERFQREASLANKLHHPGIAQTLDFGVEGETPFLIMELVEGIELAEIIEKEAPLPPARALDIAIQLTQALAEAHHHNLIHRDIKPANLPSRNENGTGWGKRREKREDARVSTVGCQSVRYSF